MAGIVCCEIAVRHQVAGVVSVGPICPGPETKEAFEYRVEVIEKGMNYATRSLPARSFCEQARVGDWCNAVGQSLLTDQSLAQTDGLEGIVNSVDIPTRATGSKASKTAEAFVRSLIQSSNPEAYKTLAQAIADAPVPEYNKIKVPLLCVAGQEDQVAQLEDLALIGDEYVNSTTRSLIRPSTRTHTDTPFPTVCAYYPLFPTCRHLNMRLHLPCMPMPCTCHATYKTGAI